MKRLANYFFQGLIYLAPIAFTVWVFVSMFQAIDGLLDLPVPGVGVAILIVLTTTFGFLLSNYLAKRMLTLFESVMDRLPFVKLLHGSMKDLMSAFVGEQRRFKHPVAVELVAGSGIKILGFLTREDLTDRGMPDHAAVYFPQAYNFAGQLLCVPRDRIQTLQGDSSDLMTFIVSGGVATGGSMTKIEATS